VRRIAITLVIAGAAALLGLLAGEAVGRFGQLIWLAVPVILIAGIAMAVGRTRGQAVLIAAAIGFLAVIVPVGVVAVAKDMSSKPNCDGFCMTRAEASTFIVFIGVIWGLLFAGVSVVAVLIFCPARPRGSSQS